MESMTAKVSSVLLRSLLAVSEAWGGLDPFIVKVSVE